MENDRANIELVREALQALRDNGVSGFADGSYSISGASAVVGGVGYAAYWPDQKRAEQELLDQGRECVRFVRIEDLPQPPPKRPPLPPSI